MEYNDLDDVTVPVRTRHLAVRGKAAIQSSDALLERMDRLIPPNPSGRLGDPQDLLILAAKLLKASPPAEPES